MWLLHIVGLFSSHFHICSTQLVKLLSGRDWIRRQAWRLFWSFVTRVVQFGFLPSFPDYASSKVHRDFLGGGRAVPNQQWCTAGWGMKSGPSVTVQCSGRELCLGFIVQQNRKKRKGMMSWPCLPLPLLYDDIWSNLCHFIANGWLQQVLFHIVNCTGQFSSFLLARLCTSPIQKGKYCIASLQETENL